MGRRVRVVGTGLLRACLFGEPYGPGASGGAGKLGVEVHAVRITVPRDLAWLAPSSSVLHAPARLLSTGRSRQVVLAVLPAIRCVMMDRILK